jgi:phospholipid-binding lipoprotein MlaA
MRPATCRSGLLRPLLAAAFVFALGACATRPPASDVAATQEYNENNDPLEPANRVSFAVNEGLDTYFLAPVARAYRYAVPGVVRRPVHNLLSNMSTPVLFINDVVQTRPRAAGTTFMRFVINTTVGVGGVFDVAAGWGYPFHDNDFGLTMALWGIPEGPFLFLPLLGPSNPRDAAGYGVDIAFDPFTWTPTGYGLHTLNGIRTGLTILDARTNVLDEVDSIKKTALDPYATFRSLYRQNRQNTVDTVKSQDHATVPNWYAP